MANERRRKYGWMHQQARKRWAAKVKTGRVICWRCQLPIAPGDRWDLGHTDDGTGYAGPEHSLCNRRAGGKARAAQLYGSPKPVDGAVRRQSRDW
jgi:hypothetical protein